MDIKFSIPDHVITKEEAVSLGLKYYFTGTVCQNNHIEKRYVNTGICYACKRSHNVKDFKKHRERVLTSARKSKKKHRVKRSRNSQLWAENNRERSNQIKKRCELKNKEKYSIARKNAEREKRKNPFFRIHRALSKQIWAFLKGKKGGRKWESLVGYTFNDLQTHLESQFAPEMSFNNYGSVWEIDHKKPLSWFEFNSDEDVKEAWALKNLQPLPLSVNRSKGNRFESP
jgi:hypothetical protein